MNLGTEEQKPKQTVFRRLELFVLRVEEAASLIEYLTQVRIG
jgi:hypothetical protein